MKPACAWHSEQSNTSQPFMESMSIGFDYLCRKEIYRYLAAELGLQRLKKKNKILKWLFDSGAQSSCLLVQHPRKKNELHRDSITMNSSESMPSGDNEMISTWRYVNRCFTKKKTESSGWVSTVQHFKDLSSTKYNTSLLVLQMHTWYMQLCSQRSLE